MEQVRLSKLMSERGLCSRREADRYIEAGQVLVNGEIVDELGTKVSVDAHIELEEAAKRAQSRKITILLNKPIGFVSNLPEHDYPEAVELITPENQFDEGKRLPRDFWKKLAVAGRLDIDSKGLLVLTQDGAIVKQLIGPESNMEKEYLVRVEGEVSDAVMRKLRHGLELDGKRLKPAQIDRLEPQLFRFILREGRKRQIRRMCVLVGLEVTGLKRVRIGRVRLGDLPEGQWRFLGEHERFV